eukprot:2342008-Rhodomonas_salina.2
MPGTDRMVVLQHRPPARLCAYCCCTTTTSPTLVASSIMLCVCYGMSGTETGYAATRSDSTGRGDGGGS